MTLPSRPYQPSDYEQVIECWVAAWKPIFDTIWLEDFIDAWREQFRLLTRQDDASITLVEDPEGIAGVLIVLKDTCKVDQLFIHPRAKRLGLGRQLIIEAQSLCPSHVWLTVFTFNEQAILFYEALGFTLVRQYTSEASGLPLYEYHWKPHCIPVRS
ncbi:GNAT family N-acetyltransferase [Coralliovum pocilloporae]|uniref:GNAT family N-acetyltransferase n=1 Tax=Coralliovum pocilloporae TaxID=3066369 RepID=UPI003306F54F